MDAQFANLFPPLMFGLENLLRNPDTSPMRSFYSLLTATGALCLSILPVHAQTPTAPNADVWKMELKRAEDETRSVRIEIGNLYRRKLADLRAGFQKAADLENALTVREQEKHLEESAVPLEAKDVVGAPRSLREAQLELLTRQRDLLGAVLQKALPRLVEAKRALTVAGKLDEASEVLNAIGSLYDTLLGAPEKTANGTAVLAEDLYMAYQAARKRADQVYKGRTLALRGRALGIRPDPRDSTAVVLVVYAEVEGGFIDCAFGGNLRVREERQGQNVTFVVSHGPADANPLRFQKGSGVEVFGKCEGWDEGVRLVECTGATLWKR